MNARFVVILVSMFAFAAPAQADILLDPIPWTDAGLGSVSDAGWNGFGDPLAEDTIVFVHLECSRFDGTGCLANGDRRRRFEFSSPSPIAIVDGALEVQATVFSDVSGNSWTGGFADLQLQLPSLLTVGDFAGDTAISDLNVLIGGFPYAEFEVPHVLGDSTTNVAFYRPPAADGFAMRDFAVESALLGSMLDFDAGLVEPFIAGDAIRLTGVTWGQQFYNLQRDYLTGLVTDVVTSVNPPCMLSSECNGELEIYLPIENGSTSVPEPAPILMLGVGLAGIASWRRRIT